MATLATPTRRTFVGLGIAAAAAPARAQTPSAAGRASRPNLLMIMADQHRGDCLGVDGHPVVRTPNLDRLAQSGVRFRNAYTSTPSCTPARAALLTGLSPWHHGMLGYGRVAQRYPFTKPQALRDAGYHTMAIGKNHFTPQRNPHGYHHPMLDESGRHESVEFRSDYRAWFYTQAPTRNPDETGILWNDYRGKPYALPEELHPTVWTGDVATRFLANYQRPEPFFLKVSFARPHSPYDPPRRFWDQYANAAIPKAGVGAWAAERNRPPSDAGFEKWRGDLGEAQVREARQGYYGSVSHIDEQVGRILETLEQRRMMDNTLILYFSDHGDMTGDHHLWRKCYAYEASAHIPMLMRAPDGPRGITVDTPVELRDVLPTLLDAAGASTARQLDGISLLKAAAGKQQREWIDLEHDVCYHPSNHWSALTDGRWKYIYHAQDGAEQLFHIAQERRELTDLAGDPAHADQLRLWRGRLVSHFEERGEPFLKGGRLVPRPERLTYSPNYPKAVSL